MSEKKKKRGLKIIVLSGFLIPIVEVLIMVGFNSDYIIKKYIFIGLIVLLCLCIIGLIYGLNIFYKNINAGKRKLKKWIKILYGFIMFLYITGCSVGLVLLYGPNNYFRNLYVTTAMKTMHHQYLAKIFYSEKTIEDILNSNYYIELDENADLNSININTKEKKVYKDEYEKELLTREKGNDLYKVINVSVGTADGYLVAIYHPEKIKLITAKKFNAGTSGERIVTMCKRHGASVCINAGGFVDNGLGSDIPMGYVIKDGKVIWSDGNSTSIRQNIIGITEEGKLMLMSQATGEEAINSGVVDGIVFGPFLIVNGKSLNIVGDPFGRAPRVAIAQRKDGVMLFLVIDGENYINGATLKEVVEILEKYGAYNAANLDGGQSTSLVIENVLCNNPPSAAKSQNGRYVVTGFGLIK